MVYPTTRMVCHAPRDWEFLHRELHRFTDLMRSLAEMNDRSSRYDLYHPPVI